MEDNWFQMSMVASLLEEVLGEGERIFDSHNLEDNLFRMSYGTSSLEEVLGGGECIFDSHNVEDSRFQMSLRGRLIRTRYFVEKSAFLTHIRLNTMNTRMMKWLPIDHARSALLSAGLAFEVTTTI